MKELPRVEEEIKESIEAWEATNGREFLVGGQRFMDFVQKQWDEYKIMKENEKEQRVGVAVFKSFLIPDCHYLNILTAHG